MVYICFDKKFASLGDKSACVSGINNEKFSTMNC